MSKGWEEPNPLCDVFVDRQKYPWQVASQQSLLPFILTSQK